MVTFSAEQIFDYSSAYVGQVSVSANTTWSCIVDGNFVLDKYVGEDDTTIHIKTLNAETPSYGTIHFKYNDFEQECIKHFDLGVSAFPQPVLYATPSLTAFTKNKLNEYIRFSVKSILPTFNYGVYSNDPWTVEIKSPLNEDTYKVKSMIVNQEILYLIHETISENDIKILLSGDTANKKIVVSKV